MSAQMQIALMRGRVFTGQERLDRDHYVIVSKKFADQFFPGENPLGRQVNLVWNVKAENYEIIGVVGDTLYSVAQPVKAMMYFPILSDTFRHFRADQLCDDCGARGRGPAQACDSYSEIGIRLALGAQRSEVLRLVMFDGLGPVAVGLLIGLAGGATAATFIRSILYGTSPLDPTVLGAMVACLLLTSRIENRANAGPSHGLV